MGTGGERERQRGNQAPRGLPSPLTHRYEEEKENSVNVPTLGARPCSLRKHMMGLTRWMRQGQHPGPQKSTCTDRG